MQHLRSDVGAFTTAAHWVDELVSQVSLSDLAKPGLGEWNLRDLIGHTSRALLTVEQYLGQPADAENLVSAEAYFEHFREQPGIDVEVLQRGIESGAALGNDVAASFHSIVSRVVSLPLNHEDRLIRTLAGGMRLSNYLPTRTFELVVHGLDIANAAGIDSPPPKVATRRALDLAVSLARRSDHGTELLLALTGRTSFAPGFTVL